MDQEQEREEIKKEIERPAKIEAMINYLLGFVGRPYIWAGNGTGKTSGGFDCSGLMLEGLWAFGLIDGQDTTANGILEHARKNWKVSVIGEPGALHFFGSNRATHVALGLGKGLMLEAGGGGRSCTTAVNSTGFVRVRPISNRKDFLAAYLPNY